MIQDQIHYAPSFMFLIVTFALTIDEYLVKPILLSEKVWDPSGIAGGQYLDSKVGSERYLIWSRNAALLRMQLDNVAIGHLVIGSHVLALELTATP
jgi:hypothetical protein